MHFWLFDTVHSVCSVCNVLHVRHNLSARRLFTNIATIFASKVQMNFERLLAADAGAGAVALVVVVVVVADCAAGLPLLFLFHERASMSYIQLNSTFASIVLTVWNIFEYFVPINMHLCGLSMGSYVFRWTLLKNEMNK